MFAQSYGAVTFGLSGHIITVEVDISTHVPSFDIVGLPAAAVKESKERVRSAIKNSGYRFPVYRITVNLAPADLRKEGSGLDLPIAVGILAASGQLPEEAIQGCLFVGELSLRDRPFRSPHHTISMAGLIGGGTVPRPGEVTLAHRGVLFLDELPEFPRSVLEVLRQPLEDRVVRIARANAAFTYPADFILIAAMNPCPCGYLGDPDHECTCTDGEIQRYRRKISGPLLDRIDLHVSVSRPKYSELTASVRGESSADVAARVAEARRLQQERLAPWHMHTNSEMSRRQMQETCPLDREGNALLRQVFETLHLSARSYDRIIKVARTIADLAGKPAITAEHIAEAVSLRNMISRK